MQNLTQATNFNLPDQSGKLHSLDSYPDQNIILFFYPKDDTSGCTIEAKDFSALKLDFAKANSVVLGISKDSIASHNKFICKHNLTIDLLSDEDGEICNKYNVWVEKSMYGKKYMGIERTTFLINKNKQIVNVWNKVKIDGHASEVLQKAIELS